MSNIPISFMEHDDIPVAANVLSLAMLNNPLHIAIFQGNGEDERLAIEKIFLKLLHERPGIVFLAKDRGMIIGVMRMNSCVGKEPVNQSHDPEDLQDVSSRQAFWLGEWATRDPREQHWHLGPIGVLSSYRKKGIGFRLMQRFCEEVDKCSAKAYLETDLDENVRFYKKFGFEVVATSKIFDVENRYMERDPQT